MGTLVIGRSVPALLCGLTAIALFMMGCGSSQGGGSAETGGSSGSAGAGVGGGSGSGGSSSAGSSGTSPGGAGGASGTSNTGGASPVQACAPTQPFGTPVMRAELNTGYRDAAARLTADELTVVFYARLSDDDNIADADLYIAERESANMAFSGATPLALNSESSDEMRPWIAGDGLTLLYDVGEAQNTGSSTDRTMLRATRSTRQDEFVPVAEFGAGESPYVLGGADGTLYYAAAVENGAILQVPLSAWIPSGQRLTVLPAPSERPVPTSDGLALYFAMGPNYNEIHMAQRPDTSSPFDGDMIVSELVDGYAPSWLSADGCRLYFDVDMGGEDLDIFVAERVP